MDVASMGSGLVEGLAYCGVGLALLLLGYAMVDLLTPGRLSQLIYAERNVNAALVVSSGLVAVATIVTTAIMTSDEGLADGIASTAAYGVLGVFLLGVTFVVLDRLTPGKLGVICTDVARHPAVYVTVAAHLAVGAIVAAAIS